MIALKQSFRRGLAQHAVEFPGEILGILQTRIGAAGAEGRDLMRGVARKSHAAMDELVHAAALELVERDPLEIELVVAEHARDPRPHVFGPLLDCRIGVRMQLQVDAPDVVGLLVQQRRAAGMKRRVEPEPALGRKGRGHLDVGDQELILEHLPCEFRAHHLPQRRAGAVAGDDVLGASGRDRQASRWSSDHKSLRCSRATTLLRQRRSIAGNCSTRSTR